MKSINCGLLINSIDYYLSYLEWFIKLHEENKINLHKVYCNNNLFIVDNLPHLPHGTSLVSSYQDVVSTSEIIFSLGYWEKIGIEFIDRVPLGILNIHHSYKLKYRGRHMNSWVIINNEKIHGTTLYYMNDKIDDGDIIDTDFFKILNNDTSYSLTMKANNLALKLLNNNIDKLLKGKVESKIKKSHARYFYKEKDLTNKLETTSLKDPMIFLRFIRALTYPNKPVPYMIIDGIKINFQIDK
jgi:methionyl-tRNA formyltransferase